jgi:hypothetical protein
MAIRHSRLLRLQLNCKQHAACNMFCTTSCSVYGTSSAQQYTFDVGNACLPTCVRTCSLRLPADAWSSPDCRAVPCRALPGKGLSVVVTPACCLLHVAAQCSAGTVLPSCMSLSCCRPRSKSALSGPHLRFVCACVHVCMCACSDVCMCARAYAFVCVAVSAMRAFPCMFVRVRVCLWCAACAVTSWDKVNGLLLVKLDFFDYALPLPSRIACLHLPAVYRFVPPPNLKQCALHHAACRIA